MDILYFILLLLLISIVYQALCRRTKLPLPPGPVGSFITGIKNDLPSSEPWKTYATWSGDYQSTSSSPSPALHSHLPSQALSSPSKSTTPAPSSLILRGQSTTSSPSAPTSTRTGHMLGCSTMYARGGRVCSTSRQRIRDTKSITDFWPMV